MVASNNPFVSAAAGKNSSPYPEDMKPKQSITFPALLAFTAVFALCCQPMASAGEVNEREEEHEEEFEEEEEIPEPTVKETLAFIRKEIPVAIEILEMIREAEGEEEYEEVLEDFREQYYEYLEIKAYDGPEAAKLVLEGAQIDLQLDKALHEYHEGENEAGRAKLEKSIQGLVRKQWQHAIKVSRMELELIDEHRNEVKAELEELEAMDEAALKEWADELIHGDEDEDDEEE